MRVIWLHNKKEVLPNDPVFKLASHSDIHSLSINQCFPEDGGIFVCEVYNDVGDCETCCRLRVRGNVFKSFDDVIVAWHGMIELNTCWFDQALDFLPRFVETKKFVFLHLEI